MRYQNFLIFALLIYAAPLHSANWVESNEEYSIDWTSMRLSFSGHSENKDSFELAVQKAWGNGLIAIRDAAKGLYLDRVSEGQTGRMKLSEESGKLVARNTFETKTWFSNAGGVRVEMQSLLSNAFPLDSSSFSAGQLDGRTSLYSGVLFTFSQNEDIKPLPVVKILDAEGRLFYSSKSLTKQIYSKRLMGRWLKKASAREIARYLGSKILTLNIQRIEGEPSTFKLTTRMDSSLRNLALQTLSSSEVVFHVR